MSDLSLYTARALFQAVLDIVLPPLCVLCRMPGSVLCPACQEQLTPWSGAPRCRHCHNSLTASGCCLSCLFSPLPLNGLRAYSTYQGALRSCIHALKYEGQTRLAQPLGALLAQTYASFSLQADYLIPLPLHEARERQRGYNQATLLARVCSSLVGVPLSEKMVIRHRATASQVGLSPQARRENMLDAFICPTTRAIFQRRIIIIDDVCTTGATLASCAHALFQAGAASVWGLVLARPCATDTLNGML